MSPFLRSMRSRPRRRGTVLPQLAITLVGLCGFVALAIDIGLIAVARTQAQNAADAAAMAGARRIDGSTTPDLAAATAKATATATANQVLNRALTAAEVSVRHGAYHYDSTAETFTPQYPPVAPDNYNLTEATVTTNQGSTFARVFGITTFQVKATAVSAHRPRDITIILDFSGSMNNESDLWNNEGYLGSVNNSPNTLETVYPQFGHYSATASATLVNTTGDPRVGKSNISQSTFGIPALVDDFYQHNWAQTPAKAFTSASDTYATTPGGDDYLAKSGTSTSPPTYAKTVQEATGATGTQVTNKTDAIKSYTNFKGYTQGPRYWGKTFFVWPPDPDYPTNTPSRDWRKRFFLKAGGSYPNFGGPMDDNTKLWDGSGNWLDPVVSGTTNYVINYAAILTWIKANPNPFPPRLRAGKLLYYDAIPSDVPSSAYNWTNASSQITDGNQRFWKEYIDYALGVWRDPFGTVQRPGNPSCSYGPDYAWGTIKVSAPVTGYGSAPTTRMHPQDNPERPRHRMWFGPMTMVQYISDTGLLPGTAHDISMYPAKVGIQGALEDIRNNHPNDLVSLILFNRPPFQNEPPEAGRFGSAQFGLSRDYTGMINSLWFPPNSTTSDVRPWDANGRQTPRAYGDFTANTCTNYGLMLAYNQLSSNSTLRSQVLGGQGRKGTQRLIILETDGLANVAASATFTNQGANKSYYNIGPTDTITPGGSATTAVLDLANRLVAPATGSTYSPGFGTPRKPVLIHCIAFGAVFEPTASGTEPASAISLLQQVSTIGGTGFPSSVTDTGPYSYKLCTGTLDERRDKLRKAFQAITDDGVALSLIR